MSDRVDYEVVELADTLRSYGVLTRADLLERSGASGWEDNSFEAALQRGIDGGAIKALGDDLLELGDDPPELIRGKIDSP
jgi:hypothetical protein